METSRGDAATATRTFSGDGSLRCNSCCFGPLCHGTFFFKIPTTICAHSGYCWCKFYEECSLPCVEEIPVACYLFPLCGLMLFPKIGCCPKADPYFPVREALVDGAVVTEAPKAE